MTVRDMSDLTVPTFGRNLAGRPLRRLLTAELASAPGPVSVGELAAACERMGVRWGHERASKLISDALRWEVEWGRVRRVGRGRYEFAGAPRTTLRRIRDQAAVIRRIIADADEVIWEAARDPAWEWELRSLFGEPEPRADRRS